jgi:hydroxyacylglutathione hydrolase
MRASTCSNPRPSSGGSQLARPELHHGGDRLRIGETEIEVHAHARAHPGLGLLPHRRELITGDTLFVFGCGRCDLKGGDPEQMFQTLRKMREGLPSDTVIHPGHNYAEKPTSTLEEQIEGNPFMCFTEMDRFVHYRMHEHDRTRETPYRPVPCKHDH